MSALNMTFKCDYCDRERGVYAENEDAIKEDLEVELLEEGWWLVRNVFWDKTFCSQRCLEDDLCL